MTNPSSIHGDVETAEVAALHAMMAYSRGLQKAPDPSASSSVRRHLHARRHRDYARCIFLTAAQNVLRWRGINVETCQCGR
jgi:hypothetical protein